MGYSFGLILLLADSSFTWLFFYLTVLSVWLFFYVIVLFNGRSFEQAILFIRLSFVCGSRFLPDGRI